MQAKKALQKPINGHYGHPDLERMLNDHARFGSKAARVFKHVVVPQHMVSMVVQELLSIPRSFWTRDMRKATGADEQNTYKMLFGVQISRTCKQIFITSDTFNKRLQTIFDLLTQVGDLWPHKFCYDSIQVNENLCAGHHIDKGRSTL